MAKIVYGVAGQGFGHSARSKVAIEHLLSQGHTVKVAAGNQGYVFLSPHFDTVDISGFRFYVRQNRVDYLATFLKGLSDLPKVVKGYLTIIRIYREFKPDLVITDFEPITAWAAKRLKLPLVSIDNQHLLTKTDCQLPKRHLRSLLISKIVVKAMVPKAKEYIVTNFFQVKPDSGNVVLVPPILRTDIFGMKVEDKGYIFCYFTSEYEKVLPALKRIKHNFVIYGFDKDERDGNIVFKKVSKEGFILDLVASSAVIANAGFTLIGEALFLGKPYLAVPQAGQFEQILNAYYVGQFGYGLYCERLSGEKIEFFVKNINEYKRNLAGYAKQDNSVFFQELDNVVKKYSK